MRSDHAACGNIRPLLLAGVAALTLPFSLRADIDERYKLSVGTNISSFNTEVRINSRDGSIDSGIDFEDDAGFDKDVTDAWISGWYRVGDNHRLRLTYIPFRRSAFYQSTRNLVIDNSTIKSGAVMAWESDTDIFDFSYIYSAYRKSDLEIGLSAGIYWLRSDSRVIAAGEVIAEGDDTPTFKSDFNASQKLHAPMPLIGIDAEYEILPAWRAHASLRYLSVEINNINGSILSAEIASDYYFNRNWGIGLSLSSFSLNVGIEGVTLSNAMEWSYNAAQVYGVFKY